MANVTNNNSASRYELQINGQTAFAEYYVQGKQLHITHVEVPAELRGGGVAAQLMAGVVADAKKQQLDIIPICSYAVAYMKKHTA